MDWKNNLWTDADIADILVGNTDRGLSGVGAKSLRPALHESFLEEYGYENRLPYFEHYKKNGVKTNVIFIGSQPHEKHQEDVFYCKDENNNVLHKDKEGNLLQSKLYKNMYEPVWITTANGESTINDNNYFATYVYRVVKMYGRYCSFYEIVNEPDFTYTGEGDKNPGEENNWWGNDPNPRSLSNLYAPVQSYIRLLRISYEVIKTLQPDALVCVGGIGYDSFLDAILRNTDNPDGGKVTEDYPMKGGAWFDCLSYHLYPMYYLKEWIGKDKPGNIDGFCYLRHSDEAVRKTIDKKDSMEKILLHYSYGSTYPRKEVIITETNVPSKPVKEYIGGEQAQRNFLTKLAIIAQKEEIKGVYPYCPWDFKETEEDGGEYDYKGFYYPIPENPAEGQLRMHESGTAWRIMSNLLGGKVYNKTETEKLRLPLKISGAAFGSGNDIIYVLWAKTTIDQSEFSSAEYTFTLSEEITRIKNVSWDGRVEVIKGPDISLSGDITYYQFLRDNY